MLFALTHGIEGVFFLPLVEIQVTQGGVTVYRYEMIIYWSDEDERFIVEVPELPGCMADGTTYEEAIKNAQQVIEEWIETARELGREIPEPRGKLAYA